MASGGGAIVTRLRWAARIWSLIVLALLVLILIIPDSAISGAAPVSWRDWIEMGLLGLAVLGLLAAWRWELIASGVAVGALILHTLAFRLLRGRWFAGSTGGAIVYGVFLVPAVLFIACALIATSRRAVETRRLQKLARRQ